LEWIIILIIEAVNIRKSFGERLILDIPVLRLYSGDRAGLVGANGAGKTTLLNVLAGAEPCDEGRVVRHGFCPYISQLDLASERGEYPGTLSGGEKTLAKIRRALDSDGRFILADEPTCNLSLGNVEALIREIRAAPAGFLIISHDRAFLNALCNKIIEIDRGVLTEYQGSYDFYRQARELRDRQALEKWESREDEKARLRESMRELRQKAGGMNKAPSRMGNSEARLFKGEVKQRAGKVAKAAKIIEGRLELLEKESIERPRTQARTKIDILENSRIYSRNAVEAANLSMSFGARTLFRDASFALPTGAKTALLGENGSGKTTLIKMLVSREDPGVKYAPGLKIAYFSQDLRVIDDKKTVLENVSETSAMSQTMIRNILARMLFFREDVFKPAGVLSGGEKVKAALCKIFACDVNTLFLDEPGNYLDIYSMEALEALIGDYGGTVLIATHDRGLIDKADRLLIIENGGITTFGGSYAEYREAKAKTPAPVTVANEILRLENRLAELSARLAQASAGAEEKEALNAEFMELAGRVREMKA